MKLGKQFHLHTIKKSKILTKEAQNLYTESDKILCKY